ncbi:GNAT family N-acetyltransferase [Paenibacillus sp. LHD-38]|uniref:GNAT family N-acetyltransferase n=1 Tax=Paenibacillus sp. LHD-38 TaxID=3072143 RepID=UPI00281098C5|nr:GNAT family N-acetyltransferase [Paenibacillus sp. LHD-38]MDQ8736048.1 GNAT family N-acetyltransferase [Paenibacillus sp. LHD-38]
MNLKLEEAVADERMFFELYAETRREEMAGWGWEKDEQQSFLAMQFRFQQQSYRMVYPDSQIRLITMDGQPIGKLHTAMTGDEKVLVDIILAPASRNKGIGTRLIAMLQEEARIAGLSLRLTVRLDNPAKQLYARMGFALFQRDELHEQMIWRSTDHEVIGTS